MANEGIVNGVNRLQDVYNFPKCSQHIKPSSKVIASMIISRVFKLRDSLCFTSAIPCTY